MADVWYCRRGKSTEGPFTRSELRQAALSGSIAPDTLISESQTGGWVAAKRASDLQFGKSIESSPPPVRRVKAEQRLQSLRPRKTWVMLAVGGTIVAALTIALAIARRDEPMPVADGNRPPITGRTPLKPLEKPTRTQAATKPLPPALITQRWQRKWLQQH